MNNENTIIKFKKIDILARIPERKHLTDSGMDICSTECCTLHCLERHTFATGICPQITEGCEIQVRARSGLAAKGLVAIFGTIDQGYTGEIRVTLINFDKDPYTVQVGERIAQLVLVKVEIPEIVETKNLTESERGANGFGSTGIN